MEDFFMNWNQLQYVITIAEEKSITKAAQKLLYFPAFPFLKHSGSGKRNRNPSFLSGTVAR